jgi:hypothetical protein
MEARNGTAATFVNQLLIHVLKHLKQIFPDMKLHGLVSNSTIPVSVSDLYIFP